MTASIYLSLTSKNKFDTAQPDLLVTFFFVLTVYILLFQREFVDGTLWREALDVLIHQNTVCTTSLLINHFFLAYYFSNLCVI